MSQNFDICSSFNFISKNGKIFLFFSIIIFLEFIKLKLGHK